MTVCQISAAQNQLDHDCYNPENLDSHELAARTPSKAPLWHAPLRPARGRLDGGRGLGALRGASGCSKPATITGAIPTASSVAAATGTITTTTVATASSGEKSCTLLLKKR